MKVRITTLSITIIGTVTQCNDIKYNDNKDNGKKVTIVITKMAAQCRGKV
jgi:hypothetical protein